jgi:hypothetical protein
MAWQQWHTFLRYKDKFLSPVQFTKENTGNDSNTLYGNRYVDVKKMLSGQSRLTYVSENTVPNGGLRELHFALTQYYLAPNLLFRNNKFIETLTESSNAPDATTTTVLHDTIIYNLYATLHIDTANNFFIKNGWHIAKDFNNGIIILTK